MAKSKKPAQLEPLITRARKSSSISFLNEPKQTKQYFKDECDINNIVGKFVETGQLPTNIKSDPQYGESPTIDLKTALDLVKNLHTEFNDLPEDVQEIFGKKPEHYAQFLSDFEESPESFSNERYFEGNTSAQKETKESSESVTDNLSESE